MAQLISAVVGAAIFGLTTNAFAHERADKPAVSIPDKTVSVINNVGPERRPHSGGTDSNGCHTNHSTGEYHCHKPKAK